MEQRTLAAGPIPANSTSPPFRMAVGHLLSILAKPGGSGGGGGRVVKVAVTPLTLTLHRCDNRDDHHGWLHQIRLATNCSEQNLVAAPWPGGHPLANMSGTGYPVILVAGRHIAPGEELCFWPSFSLWLLMVGAVPFLTPANINLTDERYVCHRCGSYFRQPNPLKIHLVLACDGDQPPPPPPPTLPPLPPAPPSHVTGEMIGGTTVSATEPAAAAAASTVRKRTSSAAPVLPRRLHTCSYCGKVYTRKYGLKIHIRTHTGSKPLSCRYCGRSFSDPSNLNKHLRLHTQQQLVTSGGRTSAVN